MSGSRTIRAASKSRWQAGRIGNHDGGCQRALTAGGPVRALVLLAARAAQTAVQVLQVVCVGWVLRAGRAGPGPGGGPGPGRAVTKLGRAGTGPDRTGTWCHRFSGLDWPLDKFRNTLNACAWVPVSRIGAIRAGSAGILRLLLMVLFDIVSSIVCFVVYWFWHCL